jgi:hypothetical protein
MSHDTHQGSSTENKTIIPFTNGFWLVIIIVGLFIGALNFIQAESGGEEGKGEGKEKTEMKAGGHEAAGEKAEKKEEAGKPAEAPAKEAEPKAEAPKEAK